MSLLSDYVHSNRMRMLLIATPLVIGSGIGLYYYFKKSPSDKGLVTKKSTTPSGQKKPSTQQDALKKSVELKELGNKSFRLKKYHEAINYYTEAIKISPHQRSKELATFYQNRAACYECLQEYEKVIIDCTQAIENDKFYIKAYLRRGKAYEAINEYGKASFDYYISVASTQFQNSDYLKLFNDSMEHFAVEKAKRVISKRDRLTLQSYLFRHLINRLSRDPLKERLSEYLSNYDELVSSLLDYSVDQESLTPEQHLVLGTVELHVGKHQEAKERLKALFDKTDDVDYKVNILVKLAEHASQQPDLDEAEKLLKEAQTLDPNNADVHYMGSQLCIIQKNNPKALECLNEAIQIDPNFVCAQGQKLFIEFQQSVMLNDLPVNVQKLKEFEELAEKYPQSNEVLLLLFQILMTIDETDKAETCIQKAIFNHRDDPSLYVFHAMVHFEKQSFEKAKELLDEAIEIDPKCSFAYEMLSDLCCRVNNLHQGMEYLETAYTNSTTFDDIKNLIIKHASLQFQQKLTNLPSFR